MPPEVFAVVEDVTPTFIGTGDRRDRRATATASGSCVIVTRTISNTAVQAPSTTMAASATTDPTATTGGLNIQ